MALRVAMVLLTWQYFTSISHASPSPSKAEHGIVGPSPRFDIDLTAMLHRGPIHEPGVFEVAYKRIQDMESSPPCQQLATSTLIDACQSFNPMAESGPRSTHDSRRSLDEVRKEYSARLAVCELQGIRTAIPSQCIPLIPSHDACHQTRSGGFYSRFGGPQKDNAKQLCYTDVTSQQLNDCVESFYQVEQRWTSFSNAHSNAIVICQASRASVENLQHLETLKTAANTQADMSEALSRTLHEAQSRLEAQKAFAEVVERFQHDFATRLRESSSRTDSFFSRLMEKADSAVEAFVNKIHRGTQTSGQGLDELNNKIEESTVVAHDLETYLQEVHNRALERSYEYANSQYNSMARNKDIATDLKNALESLRGDSVQELSESISAVDARVYGVLTTVMQAIQTSQDNLEEGQLRMIGRQALIEQSLAKQQEVIDDTSDRIQNMSFGSISGILASWAGIALCIVLISKVSIWLATCLACGAGITWAIGASSAVTQLHLFSRIAFSVFSDNTRDIAIVFAIASFVLMASAGIYAIVRRVMVYQDEEGILPKIEAPSAIPPQPQPEDRPVWQAFGLQLSSLTTS